MWPEILVHITIDYETWQPIPNGYVIDWDEDIFEPTKTWLICANQHNIQLTFYVEMAELLWLRKNQPTIAQRMEEQIQTIIFQGHDIQLHIHPAWLPEMGVTYNDGHWNGLNKNQRLHDLPVDINNIISLCKDELETLGKKADQNFKVLAFRAGKYQIQPSEKIVDALQHAGIVADSSVWKEGFNKEHAFDFRNAHHHHQPYFTNKYDILRHDTTSSTFLEIPIFSAKGEEWSFDNHTVTDIVEPLILACNDYGLPTPLPIIRGFPALANRHRRQTPALLRRVLKGKIHYLQNTLSFKKVTGPLIFTAIGHTKCQKNSFLLEKSFSTLSTIPNLKSVATTDIISLFLKFHAKNNRFDAT